MMKHTDRRPSRGTDPRICAECGTAYEALAEEFRNGHTCDPLWLEAMARSQAEDNDEA